MQNVRGRLKTVRPRRISVHNTSIYSRDIYIIWYIQLLNYGGGGGMWGQILPSATAVFLVQILNIPI